MAYPQKGLADFAGFIVVCEMFILVFCPLRLYK
jgi:hypothetical protein